MRNRKGIAAFCLVMILIFAACSKDYSYEGGPPKRCLSCSYLPLCDSSEFTYLDSNATSEDTLKGKVAILSDSVIKNRSYTKVSGYAAFNQGLFFSCENDDYRIAVPLTGLGINPDSIAAMIASQVSLPFPVTPAILNLPQSVTTSILRPSLPFNATWTDTLYNFNFFGIVSLFVGLDYKVLEKNISYQVLGNSYSNVIHVQGKTHVNSNLPIPLPPVDFKMDYYFSKDVGMIESTISSGGVVSNKVRLVSYHL